MWSQPVCQYVWVWRVVRNQYFFIIKSSGTCEQTSENNISYVVNFPILMVLSYILANIWLNLIIKMIMIAYFVKYVLFLSIFCGYDYVEGST